VLGSVVNLQRMAPARADSVALGDAVHAPAHSV